jgi:hypothetical protein
MHGSLDCETTHCPSGSENRRDMTRSQRLHFIRISIARRSTQVNQALVCSRLEPGMRKRNTARYITFLYIKDLGIEGRPNVTTSEARTKTGLRIESCKSWSQGRQGVA